MMHKRKRPARTHWFVTLLKLAIRLIWVLYSGDVL